MLDRLTTALASARLLCGPALLFALAAMCAAQGGPAEAQAVASGRVPLLAVSAVRDTFSAGDKVGKRQSGLICAPAGPLRWRDVGFEERETARAVALALKARGVDVDVPDGAWLDQAPVKAEWRLVGQIEAATLRACGGIAGPAKLIHHDSGLRKGGGALAIEWRLYHVADRALAGTVLVCSDFRSDKPIGSLTELVQIGVVENAVKVARSLADLPGTAHLAASDAGSCRADPNSHDGD